MDDSEVVKVLAEFMGYVQDGSLWREDACGRPDSYIRTDHLPRYLTDYNAIAEVWRRVDEGPYSYIYMRVRGVLDDDEHWRSWYQSKPRAHAHALAKAILEAK